MKEMKMILSFILIFVLFVSNFNPINALDMQQEQKDLTLSKHKLKKIKNWEKYIKNIDDLISKYKDDEKILKKLEKRINLIKPKLEKRNDLESKKLIHIINYLEIKVNISLNSELLIEKKIIEMTKSLLSDEEQENIQDEIMKFQLNIFKNWESILQNLINEFDKLLNYEEKGDFKLRLDIDNENIWKIKANLNLLNYKNRQSGIDNHLLWDLDSSLYFKPKWEEDFELKINTFVDYISKNENIYFLLDKLNLTTWTKNETILEFFLKIQELVIQNKYIKIEDKNRKNLFELVENFNLKKIFGDWGKLSSGSFFKAYKKDGERYFLIPTKYACDTIKYLMNKFDPLNWKKCSEWQYEDLLIEMTKLNWELYIELWENTKLWLNIENENIKLKSHIIFSKTSLEELLIEIKPNTKTPLLSEENILVLLDLNYQKNKQLNILVNFPYTVFDKTLIYNFKILSFLDKNNRFSFMDFSSKIGNFDSKLKLENKSIRGDFNYVFKDDDWNEFEEIKWTIIWGTDQNNKIKDISIDFEWEDLNTRSKFLNVILNYNLGKFDTKFYRAYNWLLIDLKFNWNWNVHTKIIDDLDFNLLLKTREKKYYYGTDGENYSWPQDSIDTEDKSIKIYKYDYPWDFKELFSSNITLKNKIIDWTTKIYEDTKEVVKINHFGGFYKNYFELNNSFNINNSQILELLDLDYLGNLVKWKLNMKFDLKDSKNDVNIYFDLLNIENKKIIEFELDNKGIKQYRDDIEIEEPEDYVDYH